MKVLAQIIVPLTFIGSLPWWYYDVRIGWLGMNYYDRIPMRWLDVVAVGLLAVSGYIFCHQARVSGERLVVRLFRVAMLLSLASAACLGVAVVLMFVLVPYVPASFPPATPGTWISLALDYAAPVVAVAAASSFMLSLLYALFTRDLAQPGAPREPGHALPVR
jgi:hypothetical protein